MTKVAIRKLGIVSIWEIGRKLLGKDSIREGLMNFSSTLSAYNIKLGLNRDFNKTKCS